MDDSGNYPQPPAPHGGISSGSSANMPGSIDEDVSDYPAFDPSPAPDWMPGFMARDYGYAQNAIWIINHPNATLEQKAIAQLVLTGYVEGYGGFLAGAAMLGYAGADAIINSLGLACAGNPVCATATGIGGTAGAAGAEAVKFPGNPGQTGHIFRDAAGHFLEDTVENRDLLVGTVSPGNYIGTASNYGYQIYARLIETGEEIWVFVRGSTIVNGGINEIPEWILGH